MQFVKPIPFTEAIDLIGDKTPIGARLNSSEWSDVPVALRQRAMFSSTIESTRFLQRAQDGLGDFLSANKIATPEGAMLATGSRAAFVEQLREFAMREGMGPLDPEDAGSLQDITSERRLGLIFDTQTRQAQDYGYWRQGQDQDVLDEFPAQRFIRVIDVKEARQAHAQFEDQVYLKTDPIWATRINQDFGVPWGPWGWGCGHDVEDVDRDESVSLGLIKENQRVEPDVKSFNENLQASAAHLDPELLQKLDETFGNKIEVANDTIRWTGVEEEALNAPTAAGTRLEQSLAAEENLLAQRRGTEKVVVMDPVGKVMLQKEGAAGEVKFEGTRAQMEDAILTHNHPRGLSFSDADLSAAANLNLSQIRVVGVRQPFTYVLNRPAAGWPADMDQRYRALYFKADVENTLKVMKGEITQARADIDSTHQAMKDLAKELKLDYERQARG